MDANVRYYRTEQRRRDWTVHATAFGATVVLAYFALIAPTRPLAIGLALLAAVCVVALARPVIGVHLLLFFSLAGDAATAPWWPFTKNLSSRESLMFVSDGLSLTPMELVLVALYAGCLSALLLREEWRFRWGALKRPMLALAVFSAFGFLNGWGGIRNIALMEIRPLIYFVALYFMIVHVFTKRAHYVQAMWVAIAATVVQSLLAINAYRKLSAVQREGLESLAEHSATLQMNVVILFALGLVAFGGARWQRRWLWALAIPVVWAFTLSQRRAAMVALFAGAAILLLTMYHRRRATFFAILPIVLVLTVGFLGATWNATGALGLPASSVKSVFFSDQLSAADQQSDLYRDLEAINVWHTIRANPLLGQGFGQPFFVVVPMPSISFFEFWQYLPHNSILWLWIKMGFFGFVSFMYTMGRSVFAGARTARRAIKPNEVVLTMVAVAYVVMFCIFAYVDIAVTTRPMVFLALCAAICADFGRLQPDSPSPLQSVQTRVLATSAP
jgi:O-antigen ligase